MSIKQRGGFLKALHKHKNHEDLPIETTNEGPPVIQSFDQDSEEEAISSLLLMRTGNGTETQSEAPANKYRRTNESNKHACLSDDDQMDSTYSLENGKQNENEIGQSINIKPNESSSPQLATTYRDVAELTDEEALKIGTVKKVYRETFPVLLHKLLKDCEDKKYHHIISWMPHGRSFKIHNEQMFVERILPTYFFISKRSSFIRQLTNYGYRKIVGEDNEDKDTYYHELFLRSRPEL